MKQIGKLLFISLLVTAATAGCKKNAESGSARAEATLTSLSVAEVDNLVAKQTCVPVDANSDATRKQLGVLPGAVMLTDSDSYALTELPTDKAKPLVFYCGGEQCKASHTAAQRAIAAGYDNVKIMSAGISGWVDAGKKVQSL
jgi:rhodanese-related sulfurtransferase